MTPPSVKYLTIPLTNGGFTYVSPHRYLEFIPYSWSSCPKKPGGPPYVRRYGGKKNGQSTHIYMHRCILGLEDGDSRHGDHVNHNTLDNTDENLRITTASQNSHNSRASSRNRCGLKGVSYCKDKKKWRARIMVNGKTIWLGYFKTKEQAYAAYCEAALKYHGEFACLEILK